MKPATESADTELGTQVFEPLKIICGKKANSDGFYFVWLFFIVSENSMGVCVSRLAPSGFGNA